MNRRIYVVLLHSPMVDRNGREVTTAVTNLDIHDIARSCRTYGVTTYFIVNPEPEQERMVRTILGHWDEEVSKVHHPSRADALSKVRFHRTFEEAFNEASFDNLGSENKSQRPFVVMPDARDLSEYVSHLWTYRELRLKMESGEIPGDVQSGDPNMDQRPIIIVFGTGWGISPKFFGQVDCVLKPLRKAGKQNKYNHLSVRAAAAIVLDRILGEQI